MDTKKLVYYGGNGFGSVRYCGDYQVKYGERKERDFTDFDKAKKFYDSLNEPKAFWEYMELIDCWWYGSEEEPDELPFL